MERYESLGPVGEGSYGTVLKCRHRDSGRLVAIKKFVDSDDDKTVKKIALREIKLLRQLRHDNLVNLLEVWKRRRRWYLVFEFVDRTLLDDLEQNPSGLDLNTSRQHLFQILRAAAFCHQQNIIHRDIKPENILISQGGVVKLCDFGFARTVASPSEGGMYTDYVATRWYRAPELLVGDIKYGKPVDVWAVGCLLMEMLTGQPLFPGDSDLDQLYHIIRCFGDLTTHHQELFYRNPIFSGVKLPECLRRVPLQQRFPTVTPTALDLAQSCLEMDPERRGQCTELLEHPLFSQDSFHTRFLDELNAKIQKKHRENATLPKITKTPRQERDEGDRRGKDKKQPEGMDEKVNKEKTEKTKGKQLSKMSKTIRNTSEPLMSTKQSKTFDTKVIHNAAQSVAIKNKLVKVFDAELRKESEISKSTKTLTEATKTATGLKDDNKVPAKCKHEKVACSEPKEDHPSNMTDTDSDNTASNAMEKNTELWRSSKSQEFGKSSNNTRIVVHILCKNSTFDHPSSSPKVSLETAVDWTDTSLALKVSQLSSNDPIEVTIPTAPSVTKQCKTGTTSEHKTDRWMPANAEHRTSENPKVLPSNYKPSKAIANPGPKTNTSSLPTSPSKTSSMVPPKGLSNSKVSKTGLTSKGLSKDRERSAVKDTKEDPGCLKMSSATETAVNHTTQPTCLHQQSTQSTTDARMISSSMPNENTSVATAIQKTLKVSDKENREDLALSVSMNPTTKYLVNQTSKASGGSSTDKRNYSGDFESDTKSLKAPHTKFLFEPKRKSGSFSNTVTPKTPKTTFSVEARKKSDNQERNDKSTSPATLDLRASTRSSILHNMDPAEMNQFDFSASHSSLPPPPPPPSSTPLLLPPSSTSLIPSFSAISTNSPVASDHLSLGAGFHPGTLARRCADKTRSHGGASGRQAPQFLSSHIAGSLTFQASEKSLICELSFLSDCCNLGNSGGVAAAKNKSQILFPDVRSSVLPELRGREGKHNKGTTKDQRKDKHPTPSSPPSDPPQH